jgi:hypothetical protein
MTLTPDGPAPYAPPSAVIALIVGFRERGYATPFTPEVLGRAGVSESLVNRTLQALKLLDLLGADGNPTSQFEELKRVRGDEEYREKLKEWLYAVYADVLKYADPTKDAPSRVTEAFRGYQPEGQRQRMVTLMLGLFEYAGLPLHAEATKRVAPAPAVKPKRSIPQQPASRRPAPKQRITNTPAGSPAADPSASGLPPQLVGLLHAIPRNGQGWTEERRDGFLKAFTAVLDFSVPIRPVGLEDLTDDDLVATDEEESEEVVS